MIYMIDMSEGGVCLCVHPQCEREREREVFWGNWGMSDGNDLIEEQIKMKMSDGMFQNKHTKRLFIFSLFSFSFFHFVPHPHIPHIPSFHTEPSISLS